MATPFPKNFRRVTGQIYAGGAPDADFLNFLRNTLKVKTILSLDANVAAKISPIVKSLGMQHLVVPINPGETRMTDQLNYLVRNVPEILSNRQPIYVHCLHGSDRTGFVIALYRVKRENMNCNAALNEARKFGYGLGVSQQVQQLWKNILCVSQTGTDISAVVDSDIVQEMRDTFQMGDVAPAFNPQQSWAPKIDDPRVRRRLLRTRMLQDVADTNDIPLVGAHNNGAIRGAGPVENSGILQLI